MSELRALPGVHTVAAALGPDGDSPLARHAIRGLLERLRGRIRAGEAAPSHEEVVELAREEVQQARRLPLRRVINAAGVILHTNLGRAPLSRAALEAIEATATGYSNLEYDLEGGARGSRHDLLRDLLRLATGAEDGLVVNNNASALLMTLQVLAAGREVLVSRGQAVEIGGGFRIPDVLRQSGARLVDVGTTNRTYARDYEEALCPDTALLLHVHSSNFRVVGFTAEPELAELVEIGRRAGVPVVNDLGSGCLIDTKRFGLAEEPLVQESVRAGVTLSLFSGDKLLGGPQAGIIVGRAETVALLRRHPLARALRVDKLTIAALAATLRAYVEGTALEEIPVWRQIAMPADEVRRRAAAWAEAIPGAAVVESRTMVGGGSLPGEGLPTWCLAIEPPEGAGAVAAALRGHDPPVLARVEGDRLLLDPRCVHPADDPAVREALAGALDRAAS